VIEITEDIELIKSLMSKVWDTATADNDKFENFEPRIDNFNGWLIVSDYGNIDGIVYVEQSTTTTAVFHPYLLGKKGSGRDMIKQVLSWFLNTPIQKVNVCIPVLYKSTYNTAKKIGFIDEGVNRKSFLKNGKYHDQFLLGLTRLEIQGLL